MLSTWFSVSFDHAHSGLTTFLIETLTSAYPSVLVLGVIPPG